jgi:hypothetical protein
MFEHVPVISLKWYERSASRKHLSHLDGDCWNRIEVPTWSDCKIRSLYTSSAWRNVNKTNTHVQSAYTHAQAIRNCMYCSHDILLFFQFLIVCMLTAQGTVIEIFGEWGGWFRVWFSQIQVRCSVAMVFWVNDVTPQWYSGWWKQPKHHSDAMSWTRNIIAALSPKPKTP